MKRPCEGVTSRKYRTLCISFVAFVILDAIKENYSNGDGQHNNSENSNNDEARNIIFANIIIILLSYHSGALTIHQLMKEPWTDG